MNTSSTKQILAALMLSALLVIIFFSSAAMTHVSDGNMHNNCPFSVMGAPLCPQNLVAAAVHHISAYQSLLNAPQATGMTVLIIALLLLAYGVFLFFVRPHAVQPLIRYFNNLPRLFSRDRGITRWLSLFENSPSLM